MSFGKMIELLQNKTLGYIVLVNCGTFYIARGKDAVLLNEIIGLKLNCFELEVCKVEVPINKIEKYTEKLQNLKYSYIIYDFDYQNCKLEVLKKYNGKKFNNLKFNQQNCYICKNTVKIYKKDDKYIQAVANLYEQEIIEKN